MLIIIYTGIQSNLGQAVDSMATSIDKATKDVSKDLDKAASGVTRDVDVAVRGVSKDLVNTVASPLVSNSLVLRSDLARALKQIADRGAWVQG